MLPKTFVFLLIDVRVLAAGIYDLHEFVDYDLYRGDARRRGGMMNELWTMDFMESVQVPQLLKRFDDLKNIRGHTDEFSLNQVRTQ
jgi:hypothetical protein